MLHLSELYHVNEEGRAGQTWLVWIHTQSTQVLLKQKAVHLISSFQDLIAINMIHQAPDVFGLMVKSLCPGIYGNHLVKVRVTAVLLPDIEGRLNLDPIWRKVETPGSWQIKHS